MTTIGEMIDAGIITRDTIVLGDLLMTADKCIVGHGQWELYWRRGHRGEICSNLCQNNLGGWSGPTQWVLPIQCYVNREVVMDFPE